MSSMSAMARCCSAASGIFSTRSRSRVAKVLTSWAMPPIRVMRDRIISLSRVCRRLNAAMTARISGALRRASGSSGGSADRSTRSTAAASCASGRVSRCMISKASSATMVPNNPAPRPTGRPNDVTGRRVVASTTSVSPVFNPILNSTAFDIALASRGNHRSWVAAVVGAIVTSRPGSAEEYISSSLACRFRRTRGARAGVAPAASTRTENCGDETASRSTLRMPGPDRSTISAMAASRPGKGRASSFSRTDVR